MDEGWFRIPKLKADDVWAGEMVPVTVEGWKLLLVNADGQIKIYANRCPHQETPLEEGILDGNVLTCTSHLWEFDARTGIGINPASARLEPFELRVDEDGQLSVRLTVCAKRGC